MSESQCFRIKYNGEALADHTIDINDLAPALLALSDIIQEANNIANDDRSRISVKVKATETGCFQIWIQAAQSLTDQTVSFLGGAHITALVNLLAMLGFVGCPTAIGLIALIKKLRGRQPAQVKEIDSGTLEIETDSGSVVVTKIEWEMYQSRTIRKSVYQLLKPLEKAGVETVEFIDEEKHSVSVVKSELKSYVLPEEERQMLEELPLRDTWVNIVHLWFAADHKWKFSEGENSWTAEIKDNDFIVKLLKGETSIHANDFLKVRVKQTQFSVGADIKSEYEIVKVLEHRKAPRQVPLI